MLAKYRTICFVAGAAILFGLCALAPAFAHPMGNFSVNHYSRLTVKGDRLLVEYFIDLAEIPTYQELQRANLADTPAASLGGGNPQAIRYVALRGNEFAKGIALSIDGEPVALRLVSSEVIFPPGAGGLPTMKMGFAYEARYPPTASPQHVNLHFEDHNYQGQSGWKEIIAATSVGSLTHSSVPTTDRSLALTNYPTDLLSNPPQQLDASIDASFPPRPPISASRVSPSTHAIITSDVSLHRAAEKHSVGSSGKDPAPYGKRNSPVSTISVAPGIPLSGDLNIRSNQQQTPRSKFTELITAQHLSLWFLFTAAIIAIGLGALHALEPGHGKTIVAAYLVGSRGTAQHAVFLGLIVTASHTVGVFALGAVTLYASRYIVPEQLYPWLGVFSGVTIAVLGAYMFLRRLTGTVTDHSHAPGDASTHAFMWKRTQSGESEPAGRNEGNSKRVSLAQLFTLGITGGIIPCPAALIVLLSAFALHRVMFGFFLIVAFSFGLAAVLIGFGLAMVFAQKLIRRFRIDGPLTKRWLPLASSGFIFILGAGIAIQALTTTHIGTHPFSQQHVGPLLFVLGLGLLLGMRHSTDADHVVAISTIVSKQQSVRGAAFIGSIWGLGHTITIAIVGSLIILCGVTIPPRVGLSMEFSVALMLVLLGILNLSGVMKKIVNFFTAMPAGLKQTRNAAAAVPQGVDRVARLNTRFDTFGWYQCIRPLIIGLVHGLAGSAAVALLVLSTIHNPYWASFYLVIFGLGTMIGMVCMTTAIALPLTYAGDHFANWSRYFGVASGVVSLCFGSFLVYQLGFLGGLFTGHPTWTPQ